MKEVKQQEKLVELYNEGLSAVQNQDWITAIKCFRAITDEDTTYQDASDRLEHARQQEKLDSVYKQGMQYFEKGEWPQAIQKFQAVLDIDPNYEEAALLLEKSSEGRKNFYEQGILHQQAGRLMDAIKCFGKAGDYIDAQERLMEVREQRCRVLFEAAKSHCDEQKWLKAQGAIEQLRELGGCEAFLDEGERRSLTLMEAYSQGMVHFHRQEWWKAIEQLRLVEKMESNYQDVASVLKNAQENNLLRRSYVLKKRIKISTESHIYEATTPDGERIAIKMPAPSLVESRMPGQYINALRRGAELSQRLKEHPNIVRVRGYEIRGLNKADRHQEVSIIVDKYQDMPIVLMDYFEACDLTTVLNSRTKLRFGEALLIAEKVCRALSHAHSQDVFHGDLKPANILQSKDGQIKVTDFANAPYGTSGFQPPEQASEGEKTIGPHTDIYSLGRTICCLITGSFSSEADDTRLRLPKRVRQLVTKATQLKPEDRYQTAQEMLADIRKANLWHYKLEERSREFWKKIKRWGILALLSTLTGGIIIILTVEPNTPVGQWRDKLSDRWSGGQTGTSIVVTETPMPTYTLIVAPDPALALISPEAGKVFENRNGVKLQWQWERALSDDEFFEVRIRLKGEQAFILMERVKLNYYTPASKLPGSGTYEWQVAVVSRLGEQQRVSETWSFEIGQTP